MRSQYRWILIIVVSTLANFVLGQSAQAQSHALQGVVLNSKLEPIPYVNVRVKELQRGTRTNGLGEFTIMLPNGRYEVLISGVGHKTLKSIIVIQNKALHKRFILEKNQKEFRAVVISKNKKDKSKEVIRNLIARKEHLQKGAGSYRFEAYIKATSDNNHKSKKPIKKDSTKPKDPSKQLAEVYLEVSKSYPDKIKEKRTGVNIKGHKNNFFYLSCTEGNFDFYANLIRSRALGQASFLSPFSPSGLVVYRYKYKEFVYEDGHMYHRIQFRPTQAANSLIKGEVWIQDKTWAIKKIRATFPSHQTPAYKKFMIEAEYAYFADKAWLPTQYKFDYLTIQKRKGKTNVKFSKYVIDTNFHKRYFNTELSATSQEAYERDSNFWKQTRPIPLSPEEINIIRYRDSIYEITHSDRYRDSVEKENNKITFLNIAWKGQGLENWRKERYIRLPAAVQLWNPLALGGVRLGSWFQYSKTFKNKRKLRLSPSISYGPQNNDIRGRLIGYYLLNPFSRTSVSLDVGRSVSNLFWNDAIINLVERSNYYLKENITIGARRELLNGLFVSNTLELGFRKSLHHLTINNLIDSVVFNREAQRPIDFDNYSAFFNELNLSYTPEQKYIREPYEKVILGSRFPTFYATWRKGIPGILKSSISYDYIELGVRQTISMGTAGLSRYNIKYGNFVREGNVEAADYKFIARGNPYWFLNPLNSFQAMDSTFALFKGFVEAHYRHDFNGALLNKIPHFYKLKIFESAGGGFMMAPERNLRYVEAFVGLEKQFTLLRQPLRLGVWGVTSYANQFKNPIQLKFSIRAYNFQRDRWD